MPKLNQINAIMTAARENAEKYITEPCKLIQKDALFAGRKGCTGRNVDANPLQWVLAGRPLVIVGRAGSARRVGQGPRTALVG
jgi:hypothetical protein